MAIDEQSDALGQPNLRSCTRDWRIGRTPSIACWRKSPSACRRASPDYTGPVPSSDQGLLEPSALSRHLTRVRGVHIHWAEFGRGRPTVLLHGMCDSHRTWLKIAPALSQARRVLMPDLPGHGLSDRPDAPYTVEWHAAIVGSWVDALRLRSFDLVGHSFGGGVAQMLLRTHADRIRRLALVASGGLGREVSIALRLWSACEAAERLAQPFVATSTRLAVTSLLPQMCPKDIAYWSWVNAMPGTGLALSRSVRSAIDWTGQKLQFMDYMEELAHKLPPMALFWGDRDRIIPVEHGADVAALLEHASLTRFASCGHWPHQEQPQAFAEALVAFLDAFRVERTRVRGAGPPAALWRRWLRAVTRWCRTRFLAPPA
jgi:pimeloyl-ACP methyl ester carboxylesterase